METRLKYSIYGHTDFTSYASVSMLFHASWCVVNDNINDDIIIDVALRMVLI